MADKNVREAVFITDYIEVSIPGIEEKVRVRELMRSEHGQVRKSIDVDDDDPHEAAARTADAFISACCVDAHGDPLWTIDEVRQMGITKWNVLAAAVNRLHSIDESQVQAAEKN